MRVTVSPDTSWCHVPYQCPHCKCQVEFEPEDLRLVLIKREEAVHKGDNQRQLIEVARPVIKHICPECEKEVWFYPVGGPR